MFFGKTKRLPIRKLAFETLESRRLLTTINVTNLLDDVLNPPANSLRAAILEANVDFGSHDRIKIDNSIEGQTIVLDGPLPIITAPVDFRTDFLFFQNPRIHITIDGSQLSSGAGLEFYIDSSESVERIMTIEGLGIINFPEDGIRISDLPTNYDLDINHNLIDGNNREVVGAGISMALPAGDRFKRFTLTDNTITSNDYGIYADVDAEFSISNNTIGTDGSSAGQGNASHGIYLANSSSVGLASISSNTISGNGGHGIFVENSNFDKLSISQNKIGLDTTGVSALIPNVGDGIHLDGVVLDPTYENVSFNTIGGNGQNGVTLNNSQGVKLAANDIGGNASLGFGNGGHGVLIDNSSNIIIFGDDISRNANDGISVTGTSSGVQVNAARIWANGTDGDDVSIDLVGTEGPTVNDYDYGPPADHDKDTGPNGLQNYPDFWTATNGQETFIHGILGSEAGKTYKLEFFSQTNAQSLPKLIVPLVTGSDIVTTDSNGEAAFLIAVTTNLTSGDLVMGTATRDWAVAPADPFSTAETSEFSPVEVVPIADTVLPFVIDLNPNDLWIVSEDDLAVEVIFSEVVTGVEAEDFDLSGLAASGNATVTALMSPDGGTTWNFTIVNLIEGPLRIDIFDGTIADEAGNFFAADFWEYTVDGTAPQVIGVDIVNAGGAGPNATFSFENGNNSVNTDAGIQLKSVPLAGGFTRIIVKFDEPVEVLESDLMLVGKGGATTYPIQDSGYVVEEILDVYYWDFVLPSITTDSLQIQLSDLIWDVAKNRLDGEWINPDNLEDDGNSVFPSGNGMAEGPFFFDFNVTAADVDRDTIVDRRDVVALLGDYGKDSGASWEEGDVSGDSAISLTDLALVQVNVIAGGSQQASSGGSGGSGSLALLPSGGVRTKEAELVGGGGTTQSLLVGGPTLSVSVAYVGSVDSSGNPVTVDITDPSTNDPSYVHEIEFRIQLDGLASDEDFAALAMDIDLGGGLTDTSGWTLATGDSYCWFGPCWPFYYPTQNYTPVQSLWRRNDDIGGGGSDLQSILIEVTPFTADNRQYGETPRPKAGQDDGLGSPTQIGSVFVQWDGSAAQIDVTPGGDTYFLTFQNNGSGAGDYTTNKTGFSGGSLVFGPGQAASLVMAVPAVFQMSEPIQTVVEDEARMITSRRTVRETAATDRAVDELAGASRGREARPMLRSRRTHRSVVDELLLAGAV